MIGLLVGLGNPGAQYDQTRHNAGFVFLDALAAANQIRWQKQMQFEAMFGEGLVGGRRVVLLKPMAYMNRSGGSVGKVLRYFKLQPEAMLVFHDELELPEGVLKMKQGGGHAGHNGLRDIIAQTGSREFYRLRIGIDRPAQGANVADYVLSRPSKAGMALIESGIAKVESCVQDLLLGEVDRVNQSFVKD
jgi:peptidyl-tRNA hydrolase, PTH1 family